MNEEQIKVASKNIKTLLEKVKDFYSFCRLARKNKFEQNEETSFLELKSEISRCCRVLSRCMEDDFGSYEMLELLATGESLKRISELPSDQMYVLEDYVTEAVMKLTTSGGDLEKKVGG